MRFFLGPSRSLFPLLLLAAILAGAPPTLAQRGAITRAQTLAELEEEAAVILQGRVESATVERHPSFPKLFTVVVRLRVEEAVKGAPGKTYTFRQFIWDVRDRFDAAGYKKGQRLLLLLTRPNENGLSSPAGLEQGRFRIERDAAGRDLALNGRANSGLLRDVESRAARRGIRFAADEARLVKEHRSGAIAASDLRGLLRRLGEGK